MSAAGRRAWMAFRRRRELAVRWRRLPQAERRDFLAVAVAIPAAAAALHTLGYQRTLRACERLTSTAAPAADARAVELALGRALRRAETYAPFRGVCLSRSVALWCLLRRRGVQGRLCLGARLDAGRLSAHAWVECDGRIVNDTPDVRERFVPLEAARSAAAR